MRKFLFIIVLTNIFPLTLLAQRTLEVVSEPFDHINISATSISGAVIIAMQSDQYLLKYNDFSLSRYNYPIVAGSRLSYSRSNPLVTYRSSAYIILNGGGNSFLYAFNGGRFSRISVPGNIVSNAVVYADNLYVLSRDRSLVKLYRYNGASIVEVPTAILPVGGFYELQVEDNSLFMLGMRFPGALNYAVKRYDGTSVFTYPYFEFPIGIKKILPVPGTSSVYFVLDIIFGRRIVYFNGSRITRLFDGPADHIEAAMFRGNLYFSTTTRSPFTRSVLRKAEGATITEVPFPSGFTVTEPAELAVYNDALLVQVRDVATVVTGKIISFDGTTFSDLFSIPTPVGNLGKLFLRNGNLMINPGWGHSNTVYEYNGTSFTSISFPGDRRITDYLGETNCNHVWLADYVEFEGSEVLSLVSLLRESKDCAPPPPPPVLVIPRYFFPFETFTSIYAARADRECWSDIIVNWEIDPICPVPEVCPDPAFLITLSDAQQKIFWQQKFDQPLVALVPLDGKLPLNTTFSSTENGSRDLILIDQDVVQNGVSAIALSMQPAQGSFLLSATTRQGVTVPLRIELLNKDGKPIWQKEMKAPFFTIITDQVNEAGEKLRISTVQPQLFTQNQVRDADAFTCVNPAHGTVIVGAKDKTIFGNAELTINNMLGQKLVSKRITTAKQIRLELPPYQPGIFIITIKTSEGKVMNKTVWLQ